MGVISYTCCLSSLCTFRLQALVQILSNKVKYTKCIKVRKRLPWCSFMLYTLVMCRNHVTRQYTTDSIKSQKIKHWNIHVSSEWLIYLLLWEHKLCCANIKLFFFHVNGTQWVLDLGGVLALVSDPDFHVKMRSFWFAFCQSEENSV